MKTKLMRVFLKVTKRVAKNFSRERVAITNMKVANGQITVTDSHCLFQTPIDAKDNLYSHWTLENYTKMVVSAREKELDLDEALAEKDPPPYPAVDMLFPNLDDHIKVLVDAHYLRDLCDAAIAGEQNGKLMLFVNPEKEINKSPVVGHFYCDDNQSIGRAIIMPIALSIHSDAALLEYDGQLVKDKDQAA